MGQKEDLRAVMEKRAEGNGNAETDKEPAQAAAYGGVSNELVRKGCRVYQHYVKKFLKDSREMPKDETSQAVLYHLVNVEPTGKGSSHIWNSRIADTSKVDIASILGEEYAEMTKGMPAKELFDALPEARLIDEGNLMDTSERTIGYGTIALGIPPEHRAYAAAVIDGTGDGKGGTVTYNVTMPRGIDSKSEDQLRETLNGLAIPTLFWAQAAKDCSYDKWQDALHEYELRRLNYRQVWLDERYVIDDKGEIDIRGTVTGEKPELKWDKLQDAMDIAGKAFQKDALRWLQNEKMILPLYNKLDEKYGAGTTAKIFLPLVTWKFEKGGSDGNLWFQTDGRAPKEVIRASFPKDLQELADQIDHPELLPDARLLKGKIFMGNEKTSRVMGSHPMHRPYLGAVVKNAQDANCEPNISIFLKTAKDLNYPKWKEAMAEYSA